MLFDWLPLWYPHPEYRHMAFNHRSRYVCDCKHKRQGPLRSRSFTLHDDRTVKKSYRQKQLKDESRRNSALPAPPVRLGIERPTWPQAARWRKRQICIRGDFVIVSCPTDKEHETRTKFVYSWLMPRCIDPVQNNSKNNTISIQCQ